MLWLLSRIKLFGILVFVSQIVNFIVFCYPLYGDWCLYLELDFNPQVQNSRDPWRGGHGDRLYQSLVLSVPDSELCFSCCPVGNQRFNLETIETRRFKLSWETGEARRHPDPTSMDSSDAPSALLHTFSTVCLKLEITIVSMCVAILTFVPVVIFGMDTIPLKVTTSS